MNHFFKPGLDWGLESRDLNWSFAYNSDYLNNVYL